MRDAEREEGLPPSTETEVREEGARQTESAGQQRSIINVFLKNSEDGQNTATRREPGG